MESTEESVRNIEFKSDNSLSLKVSLSAILAAVGVVLSWINPFAYVSIFGAKINPFAHFINAIAGAILGPIYAVFIAFTIAIVRYYTGIGSILAFPGGMSGALVVGLVQYYLKKKYPNENKKRILCAFFEPIGTVFIGATISSFIIPVSMITFWWLFALSCIPGCILGWLTLNYLINVNDVKNIMET